MLERQIDEWFAGFRADNPAIAAVDRGEGDELRWYVRMHGEAKEYITLWFTLGQRTLRYEAYVMPAPLENAALVYEQVLRRNEKLVGVHFAIGVEDALFLRGDLPLVALVRGRARPGGRLDVRDGRAGLPVADPARVREPLRRRVLTRRRSG